MLAVSAGWRQREGHSLVDVGNIEGELQTLADPVRLRLFSMIASAGTCCSCDLVGPIGKGQPTVSHHTEVLAEAGLIAGERAGRWVNWRVVATKLDELREALSPAP